MLSLAAACGGGGSASVDAPPAAPDGRILADGPVLTPDASGTPDGRAAGADAPLPDAPAAMPDAAPACVGTWRDIPAYKPINDFPVFTAAVRGQILYYAYYRPADTHYLDVAIYDPSSGWKSYSTTVQIPTFQYDLGATAKRVFVAKPDHLVLWVYGRVSPYDPTRFLFSLTTHDWTKPADADQPVNNGRFGNSDWVLEVGNIVGCTIGNTVVAESIDLPRVSKISAAANPLGKRYAVDFSPAGSKVLVTGGYNTPPAGVSCSDPQTNPKVNNGAFYDPSADTWGPLVASAAPGYWSGNEMVSFVGDKVRKLAPGETTVRESQQPAALSSFNATQIVNTPVGVVFLDEFFTSGRLYRYTTGTVDTLCTPTFAVELPTDFRAATDRGAIFYGREGGVYLDLQ